MLEIHPTLWLDAFMAAHDTAEVTANLSQQTLTRYERHMGLDLPQERVLFKSQVNKRNSNWNRPKDLAMGEVPCY